jgi:hypothetical protein
MEENDNEKWDWRIGVWRALFFGQHVILGLRYRDGQRMESSLDRRIGSFIMFSADSTYVGYVHIW